MNQNINSEACIELLEYRITVIELLILITN